MNDCFTRDDQGELVPCADSNEAMSKGRPVFWLPGPQRPSPAPLGDGWEDIGWITDEGVR
jgi:hypothetical protein